MSEEKTVKWSKVKRKIMLDKAWQKTKDITVSTVKGVKDFVVTHPAEALGMVTGVGVVIKKGSNAYCAHREKVRRDTEFYDPSTGKYSKIKRKLKPKEQVKVERLKKDGGLYSEIFYEMGLLK